MIKVHSSLLSNVEKVKSKDDADRFYSTLTFLNIDGFIGISHQVHEHDNRGMAP